MAPSPLFLTRDARILDLIRRGDEEALVMLFRDNRRMVIDFVIRNSGSPDDAEDLLQDALIVLWERVRSRRFEYAAKLSTFILGVVKNRWLRTLAARRRNPPLNEALDPPDEGLQVDEGMVQEERVLLVRKAMERIDGICRTLLTLFYWEELPMDEIARRMGFANADTAKSKKYQCKKHLERELKSLLGSDYESSH